MTKIHIFLGSSLDELHLDSETMGNYVRKLNDIYMDRDIWIQLDRGDELEEYNEEIGQSDIFLVLFYNQAGQDTIEQFHKALEQFQNTGAPAILIFFRQGEGYDPKQSVLEFMDDLGEQLGHYFKKYTHIDTVKLTLLLQMKLMKLDVPIEVEESLITVGSTPVLTLKNIPMWAKNADFQSLKEQYQACERAYLDAKAAMTDPMTDPVFLRASEQWNEAKKNLRELEQELFSIALKIEEKNNDGTLTERQRKAYELMEQGDAEGANNILDLREILDDVAHAEALAQQADKKLEQHVQEMLQKIEILKTQVKKTSRFEGIQEIFEEAVALEERRNLKKIAMREYVSYLHDQKDYSHAIPLAERYLKYAELDGDKSDIAKATNMLGILYAATNRLELAEQRLLRAKEILEQLAVEHPSVYQSDLASTCDNLGNLYADVDKIELAEQEHLRAKEIYEQLATEDPLAYQPYLARTCNNLGALYMNINQKELAEQEFLQAKESYEQLTAEHLSAYLSDLAICCNNLGVLYKDADRIELAEQEYLRAKEIQEQLVAENPSAYQPDLASTCNNLGALYYKIDCRIQAEQELLWEKKIYKQFAIEDPTASHNLASTYNNLGNLYKGTACMDMAEREYLRAKKIREQLVEENPSVYLLDLAGTCNNLGALYAKTGRMELAEQEDLRAKEIYEQLATEHLSVYRSDFANNCNHLGILYLSTHRIELAEQEFLQAKEIYEQLAEISPGRYMENLQTVCTVLDLLSDSGVLNFLSNYNILEFLSEM